MVEGGEMSKLKDKLLEIQEQTGKNLVQQQKEAYYYNVPVTMEQIEAELKKDPGYAAFMASLEDKNRPF